MADETQTETADETAATDTAQETVASDETATEQSTSTTASPASIAGAGGGSGATATVSGTVQPIDIDAELNAKDLLIDKFAAGLVSPEDYAKEVAQHDKAILKAQRELAKPAQQVQQQQAAQAAAQNYWNDWGKGKDVAQLTHGKTVKAERAAALFREARAEVAANPRYQNRPEMDPEAIAYDKWMDKLDAEAKKKPPAAGTAAPQTRVTGDTPVSQSGGGSGQRKTARQKLDDGDYNIEG